MNRCLLYILFALIVPTVITGCSVIHVHTHRIRSDLMTVYRDGGTDTTSLQGYRLNELFDLDKTYTNVLVVYRAPSSTTYRTAEGIWSLKVSTADTDTRRQRSQIVAGRLDTSDRISLFRGMKEEDIFRSIAVDNYLFLKNGDSTEQIPMWMVESMISLSDQPAYQDTVDARGTYETNVGHLRLDLRAAYETDSTGYEPIKGSLLSDISRLAPDTRVVVVYRDSTDALKIEEGAAEGRIVFESVDTAVGNQRIQRIMSRRNPTMPIGLYHGLTRDTLLLSPAATGILQIRRDRQTVRIPLWSIESLVVVDQQDAYKEYVEPGMSLAVELLLGLGIAIVFLFLLGLAVFDSSDSRPLY